jgi:hypothetical protein
MADLVAAADALARSDAPERGAETVPCTLRELLAYFLRLGTFGFGGPIALAGYMQRDLVENRRWISRQDYLEGLALAQLAPGPLAAQLAIYLGWVRARVLGATLVGPRARRCCGRSSGSSRVRARWSSAAGSPSCPSCTAAWWSTTAGSTSGSSSTRWPSR